jgi:hypothetical protein
MCNNVLMDSLKAVHAKNMRWCGNRQGIERVLDAANIPAGRGGFAEDISV